MAANEAAPLQDPEAAGDWVDEIQRTSASYGRVELQHDPETGGYALSTAHRAAPVETHARPPAAVAPGGGSVLAAGRSLVPNERPLAVLRPDVAAARFFLGASPLLHAGLVSGVLRAR